MIELTTTVAGPAAGAMLAEWGADVVKVEAPGGDTFRRSMANAAGRTGALSEFQASPAFYSINRGKRSVVLDLKSPTQLAEAMMRLVGGADVFITNFRQQPLARMGLDAEALTARLPALVYVAMTGYGRSGPEADAPGYDLGAFYGKSGVASAFSAAHPKYGSRDGPADPPPLPPHIPGGFGDVVTAMAAVSGVGAALHGRRQHGRGCVVDTSLLRAGIWTNFWEFAAASALGRSLGARGRHARLNPLLNCYRTRDGKALWLLGLESQRRFPPLARALDRGQWLADPRFATASARAKACVALTRELDAAMAALTLAELAERFERCGVWWQKSQPAMEAALDPQVLASGAIVQLPPGPVDVAAGDIAIGSVRGPVDFSCAAETYIGPVPALGEHTRDVLTAAGVPPAIVAEALKAKSKL